LVEFDIIKQQFLLVAKTDYSIVLKPEAHAGLVVKSSLRVTLAATAGPALSF
jgi:hypothetical protein